MKVFGGETGPEVVAVRFLPVREGGFLVLRIVTSRDGPFGGVVAVIDDLLDLMFDLFLADGPVGVRRVFRLRFLFAVKGFQQFFVGGFLFFLERGTFVH
jgi:hypothetical protein